MELLNGKDLRIGNYVFNQDGKIVAVAEIKKQTKFDEYMPEHIKAFDTNYPFLGEYYGSARYGIPIEVELLEKVGFIWASSDLRISYIKDGFIERIWLTNVYSGCNSVTIRANNYPPRVFYCKYFHNLQNTIYQLTGHELTFDFKNNQL